MAFLTRKDFGKVLAALNIAFLEGDWGTMVIHRTASSEHA
jgi:hypothetical protein